MYYDKVSNKVFTQFGREIESDEDLLVILFV